MKLADTRVGTRLVAGFLFVLILLAIIVGIAWWRLQASSGVISTMMEDVLVKERLASEWAASTNSNGARTMILVYHLPSTEAMYQRFAGIDGSAYFVGGFGMTALGAGNIVLVPIRSGVGLRLGANIGYLHFTRAPTWNPF